MTDLRLRFPSVKAEELQWVMCQDAGWCNRPDDLSQSRTALVLADNKITADVNNFEEY